MHFIWLWGWHDYHMSHFDTGFILLPGLHWNTSAKAGVWENAALTRTGAGACSSVRTPRMVSFSWLFMHQFWAPEVKNNFFSKSSESLCSNLNWSFQLLNQTTKSVIAKDNYKGDERAKEKVKKWYTIESIKYFRLINMLPFKGLRYFWNDEKRFIELNTSWFIYLFNFT